MRLFKGSTIVVLASVLTMTACDDTDYYVKFVKSQILKPFVIENDAGRDLAFRPINYEPDPQPTEEIDVLAVPGINHTTDLNACDSGSLQSRLRNDLFFVISRLEEQAAVDRELNAYAIETLENTPLCRPFASRLQKINELLTGSRPELPAPTAPSPIEPNYVITGVNLDLDKRKPEIKLSTSGGMVTLKTNLSKKDLKEALDRNTVYIPANRTGKDIAIRVNAVPGTAQRDNDSYTYETSCQHSYTETRCEYINHERICRDIEIYTPGTKNVTVSTYTKTEDFNIILQKDNKSVAETVFNLREENTYRSSSVCVPDYPPHHGGFHH